MTRYTLALFLVLACAGHLAAASRNPKLNYRRALKTIDAHGADSQVIGSRRLAAAAGDGSDAEEEALVAHAQGKMVHAVADDNQDSQVASAPSKKTQAAANDVKDPQVGTPAPAPAPAYKSVLNSMLQRVQALFKTGSDLKKRDEEGLAVANTDRHDTLRGQEANDVASAPAPAADGPKNGLSSALAPLVKAVKEPLARRLQELFGGGSGGLIGWGAQSGVSVPRPVKLPAPPAA